MFSTARNMDTTTSQLDKEEDINGFQPQGFDREEITSYHLLLVMPQEGAPGAFRSAFGHRRNAMLLEQITDGGPVNGKAEFEQLPFNAIVSPTRIVPCQLEYQQCQFGADFRTSNPGFLLERPFTSNQLAMPTQDGIGFENEHGLELGPEIAGEALHLGDEDGQ